MTRLLVVGANGQVGRELRRSLAPLGEVVGATRDGVLDSGEACRVTDLSDPQALAALVADLAPSAVVNAAAYTAVDRAETEEAEAYIINTVAPGRIAAVAAQLGVPVIHLSTDYVFDGEKPLIISGFFLPSAESVQKNA